MRKYLFILLFLTTCINLFSQAHEVDSLKRILAVEKNDTNICFLYQLIGHQYYYTLPDSSIYYWNIAKDICVKKSAQYKIGTPQYFYFKKNNATMLNNIGIIYQHRGENEKATHNFEESMQLSESINDIYGICTALTNIGFFYQEVNNDKKAIEYYSKALELEKKIGDLKGVALSYNNIGLIYQEKGDSKKALDNYFESLRLLENLNDKKGSMSCLNNIAFVYEDHGDNKKALEYFQRAINIAESYGDKRTMAHLMNNIAKTLGKENDPKVAIEWYSKSLKIFEELGEKKGVALIIGNIGLQYKQLGDFKKAMECYQTSLKMREELNDKKGICYDLNNIGHLKLDQKDIVGAMQYAKRLMTLAEELQIPKNIKQAAELLYFCHKAKGQYQEALQNFELTIKMRDSLNNESTRKASIKSQLKYEYEKQAAADSVAHAKESEIKNVELKRQSAEIKAKKNQQYVLFGGLFLVCLFGAFMFNRFKVTQKQKNIIELQKEEVERQKNLVDEKQREVLDSIIYAKRIQMAQIPSDKRIALILQRLKA